MRRMNLTRALIPLSRKPLTSGRTSYPCSTQAQAMQDMPRALADSAASWWSAVVQGGGGGGGGVYGYVRMSQ